MAQSPSSQYAVERLRPHTLDHLKYWASLVTLDNGRPWELEPFQEEIFADVLAGYREVLVVLPTGNYKTTSFGGFAVYHAQFTPDASVPIGASSRKQAGILYKQAAGFIERSPWLRKRFKVSLTPSSGITCLANRSKIEVYAASDDTGDGIIPTLAFIDELHRHKGHDLYGTWRDKLTKRNGQLVTISTAGDDENNPLEQLREQAHQLPERIVVGRHTIARSEGSEFCMHEFALRQGDDPQDLDVVKMANPAAQVTIEELRMRRDSPSTKLWHWLRFTCNLRSKGEDSAIAPEVWDALHEKRLLVPGGIPHYLGLDLGWKIDHSAVTPLGWESATKRFIHDVVTLAPPVAEDDVVAALLRTQLQLHEADQAFSIIDGSETGLAVVYDPNAGAQQMVQQIGRGEHPLQTDDTKRLEHGLPTLAETPEMAPLVFVEHSQDNAPMSLAATRWDEALRNRWFSHDDGRTCSTSGCRCGGMRGHVLNAVEKTLGAEKWRYDRPSDAKGEKRRKYPTDALTGGLIANSVAVAEMDEGEPLDPDLYRMEFIRP